MKIYVVMDRHFHKGKAFINYENAVSYGISELKKLGYEQEWHSNFLRQEISEFSKYRICEDMVLYTFPLVEKETSKKKEVKNMKAIRDTVTISNDNTIYIPPVIRGALNLKWNDKLSLEVVEGAIILKPYFDIVDWATNYLHIHELKGFYEVGRDRLKGITIVILINGRVGVAKCDQSDAFIDVIGEAIALARALGEDDKIPKEILSSKK